MPAERPIGARWLGLVEYGEGLDIQEQARSNGLATGEQVIFGLEHLPVITLGKRGGEVDREAATAAGYALWQTRRGGLATCHEPGQLVGYLSIDARALGVRRLVERVEGALIAWLHGHGIVADRRGGMPGVWVQTAAGPHKIAAVGMQIRGGWTMHGFALNLTNTLAGFGVISPCGIRDGGVTSCARLGVPLTPAEAWPTVEAALIHALLAPEPLRGSVDR